MLTGVSGARGDALRFLLAGGVNTVLTSAIYLLFALVLKPTVAYAIAWCLGLLFVAVVYPDHVYRGGRNDVRSRFWLVVSTVTVFVIGIFTLQVLVALTGIHQIAFFITLAVTTCLNFVLGRLLLRRD